MVRKLSSQIDKILREVSLFRAFITRINLGLHASLWNVYEAKQGLHGQADSQ
jgi:hypothetical protein